MTVDQFILDSQTISSQGELFNRLMMELEALGYDQASFNLLTNHAALGRPAMRACITNIANPWLSDYVRGEFDHIDPFHQHCFYGQGVLTLNDLKRAEHLTANQAKFLKQTEVAGLYDRMTIALRGGSGTVASLDLFSSSKLEPIATAVAQTINLLAQHFYTRIWRLYSRVLNWQNLALTDKERLVLEWSAQGLTKAEIGVQMNISSHTVDYHSRKLAKKLGARNITAAAVSALKRGLIHV
ncbi:helix-turn-helix transcriptional regulator [Halioxenophilus sp. WMMB6]|uniref:helix-turn-helix transcriptional regulator n=1 Tax=Halioxenophilus sp. WMMB6 TaxID=3073815 RepID=UPI00295E73DE|nr:LuxR C-terminal-related transcriptional regulator [Halioxenophilus sp. WMMB6]